MICKYIEFLDLRQTVNRKLTFTLQFDVETKVVSLYIYTEYILSKCSSLVIWDAISKFFRLYDLQIGNYKDLEV